MKATAAVLKEVDEPLVLEEVEMAELLDDEVLVKMKGVGICHTDMTGADGTIPLPLPTVLGHEGSGVVEQVGADVKNVAPGDHVVLTFGHCGECENCEKGHPAYCEVFSALNYFGSRMDGTTTMAQGEEPVYGNFFAQSSFATYAISNGTNAVKIDKDVPLELMGPLGCGLQTGAGSVMKVLQPSKGEGIGIFGLGGVGLSAIMAAAALECDPIIAFDTNPARLEMAKDLGATHTFNPTEHKDLIWDVMQVAAPGLHYTFDAVGFDFVIKQALELLRSPGHAVTVGFQGLEYPITIDQGHLLLGRRLSGVIEGDAIPQEFIPELVQLYKDGKFPLEKLIKTFPFSEINEAIKSSHDGEVIKPVLLFD